jgi:hypothetical protein
VRRWLAAGTLAGTIALTAGCTGAGQGGDANPRPSAGGAQGGPGPAPATAAPSSDPTVVNTHQVCSAINDAVARGTSGFGVDLGAMVGHLAGNNPRAAQEAKDSAIRRLTGLAATVRMAAAPALNPDLRTAAESTAGNLDRIAADPGLLVEVKTILDMSPVIGRITASADPLTNVCV